jgi:hypothetical protein
VRGAISNDRPYRDLTDTCLIPIYRIAGSDTDTSNQPAGTSVIESKPAMLVAPEQRRRHAYSRNHYNRHQSSWDRLTSRLSLLSPNEHQRYRKPDSSGVAVEMLSRSGLKLVGPGRGISLCVGNLSHCWDWQPSVCGRESFEVARSQKTARPINRSSATCGSYGCALLSLRLFTHSYGAYVALNCLRRLSEGPNERPPHSVSISESIPACNLLNRESPLFHHQPCRLHP